MRGKNIEELKNKFQTDRLIKRRNRVSIEFKKSTDLKKQLQDQKKNYNSSKPARSSLIEGSPNHFSNLEQNHSQILNHFNQQSEKFK